MSVALPTTLVLKRFTSRELRLRTHFNRISCVFLALYSRVMVIGCWLVFFFSEERIGRWFDVYAGLSLDDAKITIRSVAAFQQFIDSSSMLYGRSPLIRSKKMHYPYDSQNWHIPRSPSRVPISAFIVEDMTEFVQAHASYRFVIFDEEDERPRLLVSTISHAVSLLSPIQISDMAFQTQSTTFVYFSKAVRIAEKRIHPYCQSTLQSARTIHRFDRHERVWHLWSRTKFWITMTLCRILNKHPGFPQAEYLFYPFNVCKHLAVLLKESNQSYPESLRTMTGLDVGWLHRA